MHIVLPRISIPGFAVLLRRVTAHGPGERIGLLLKVGPGANFFLIYRT